MAPPSPPLRFPRRFRRTSLNPNFVQSICEFCSCTVGYSPNSYALDVAEKLHACSVPSGAFVRVFVVDDDESVAHSISEALRAAEFEVFTFNDGLLAAQYALESPPDVVVTDYAMPHINGLVLTAWLRVNCPACGVVIISGDAATVIEQAPIGLKFALLQKPILTEELLAAVRSYSVERTFFGNMSDARHTRKAK